MAPPGTRGAELPRVPGNFPLAPGNCLASRPRRTLRLPTHTCVSMAKVMALVMSPPEEKGKQPFSDNSHQRHQIWRSRAPRAVCPRRGVAPAPAWEPERIPALRSSACRQGLRGAGRTEQWFKRPRPGDRRTRANGDCQRLRGSPHQASDARVPVRPGSPYSSGYSSAQVLLRPKSPSPCALLLPLPPHPPPPVSASSAVVPRPVPTGPACIHPRQPAPRAQRPQGSSPKGTQVSR